MAHEKVAVISLGGTISSTWDAGGVGVVPSLSGEALVEAVPELREEFAEVSAESFRQVPGSEVALDDVVGLAGVISSRLEAGARGVVVTQGTDTIEETSFALDLLVDGDAPVVVTGAMRNPTLPGADGPANLLAAVGVAASEEARGLGAVVVFNDEIHAARFVRKTHTQSPATFRSPLTGPVGWVAEGVTHVAVRPVGRPHHIALPPGSRGRPVALYTASIGDDGRLLPEILRLGYEGLVVEALGGGHVPSGLVEPLAVLAAEMPVVLASRTGGGQGLRHTDLLGRGLVSAGPLDGPKARVLLSLLLRSGAPREEIFSTFDRWPH